MAVGVGGQGNSALHALVSLPPCSPDAVAEQRQGLNELIAAGADVGDENWKGETPLQLAVRAAAQHFQGGKVEACGASRLETVRSLLTLRADPNAGNLLDETPLMEAACAGDSELCRVLLESGADALHTSRSGLVAADFVSGAPEVTELLASWGGVAAPAPRLECLGQLLLGAAAKGQRREDIGRSRSAEVSALPSRTANVVCARQRPFVEERSEASSSPTSSFRSLPDATVDRQQWADWEERSCAHRVPHAEESPGLRRAHSWGRTLAHAKVALGVQGVPMRMGRSTRPFVVWVLCATDCIEAWLAEEGYFDLANEFDDMPTQVFLLGHGLRAVEARSQGATDFHPVAVASTASYERARELPLPDLVAVFMPGDGAAASIPKHVLGMLRDVPAVVSTRFQLQAEDKDRLSGYVLLPQVRCPFSACPESLAPAHDDNGWIFAVRGAGLAEACSLAVPSLPPVPERPLPRKEKAPVAFWGILDMKFDTSLPVLERLKILELGDGKTSQFSGDGRQIRERYDHMHKLQESAGSATHDVVSADKKFMHDEVRGAGYEHLLPVQACFPKEYHPELAAQVVGALGLAHAGGPGGDSVVLKLCNRSRAAGIVVVNVGDLDGTLHALLTAPEDVDEWLRQETQSLVQKCTTGLTVGQFEECRRHWWSNESPVFLAERLCTSLPCPKNGEAYDATLRVGFALRSGASPSSGSVEWLGCYWKLPRQPLSSQGARSLQERVVSSVRTNGTAAVDPWHASEVYAALTGLLPQLFRAQLPSVEALEERYKAQPALAAYFVARFASAMQQKLDQAKAFLSSAEKSAAALEDGQAKNCVRSFIQRWQSVLVTKDRGKAWSKNNSECLKKSLSFMPWNANSYYIQGVKSLQERHFGIAVAYFHKSLALDPDFKAPYVNLGICHLQMEEWQKAIDISEEGLVRHTGPQLLYHMGVAKANLAMEGETGGFTQLQEAKECLDKARKSAEGQRRRRDRCEDSRSPWTPYDDTLCRWLDFRLEELRTQRYMMPGRIPGGAPLIRISSKGQLGKRIGWDAFSCRV